MRRVTLISATGCHLCAQAKLVLERARQAFPFELEEILIDGDMALEATYRSELPVVLVDGRKRFKYRVDAEQLLRTLRAPTAASDGSTGSEAPEAAE